MTVEAGFFKTVPYFSGIGPAGLEEVTKLSFEKTVERDEVIILEGQPPDALYFVMSGVVKVYKTSEDGKEQILRLVRPGESFNDVSVFDGGLNPASAEAMGPATVEGIRKDDLYRLLRNYPELSLSVNRILAGRVRELMSLVEDLSFKNVIGRVAKILLEHSDGGSGSPPRLTQREMAALAGTAREVIGRSLKSLEEAGAINLDRHRIVITDRETLRRVAGIPSGKPVRPETPVHGPGAPSSRNEQI